MDQEKVESSSDKTWMPRDGEWTFRSGKVAANFDKHVREQLPWYDFATQAIAHLVRHYIPKCGLVYDVGASTGNIGNAMRDVIESRCARFVAVEESAEMAALYTGPKDLVVEDAVVYDFQQFDFAVCFLLFMFLPVRTRWVFAEKLVRLVAPGGALVVVDKVNTPPGYAGTVIRRLNMRWKLDAGSTPDEIVAKELSLAGCQRPVDERIFGSHAVKWFQVGEFTGWIVERAESGEFSSLAEVIGRNSM